MKRIENNIVETTGYFFLIYFDLLRNNLFLLLTKNDYCVVRYLSNLRQILPAGKRLCWIQVVSTTTRDYRTLAFSTESVSFSTKLIVSPQIHLKKGCYSGRYQIFLPSTKLSSPVPNSPRQYQICASQYQICAPWYQIF